MNFTVIISLSFLQNAELSGQVASPEAASCPRTGGHRVSRGWCRRGRGRVVWAGVPAGCDAGKMTMFVLMRDAPSCNPPRGRVGRGCCTEQDTKTSLKGQG